MAHRGRDQRGRGVSNGFALWRTSLHIAPFLYNHDYKKVSHVVNIYWFKVVYNYVELRAAR
eukprot:scaffold84667_cov25-Prasinocladus_malaysianus.AAC.1